MSAGSNQASSSILPEAFRCNLRTVRVFKPKCILLDFHGTISAKRWEDNVLYPYAKSVVVEYLKLNWANDAVQACLQGLKNESFEQHFKNRHDEAPVVHELMTTDGQEVEPEQLAEQVGEFVQWQLKSRHETNDTRIITRLVWSDGLRRGKIATPLYDDVKPWLTFMRNKYHCSVHVASSLDEATLRLFMEHSNQGNMDKLVDSYLSAEKPGSKLNSNLYEAFYKSWLRLASSKRTGSHKEVPASSRPILFITDSGQEAKAARLVEGGSVYECVLMDRPGNKQQRRYYQAQFPTVGRLEELEVIVAPAGGQKRDSVE